MLIFDYSKEHMTSFAGKKVAVLGSGIEGQKAVDFLLQQQAVITVLDEKTIDSLLQRQWESQGVTVICQPFTNVAEYEIVVRSPGIRPDISVLEAARQQGVVVTSSTQIFLERAKGTVVGVTGTKGKGTTSQLLYNIIAADRDNVFLGGNIGTSPLGFLPQLNDESITILELSSFQLADVTRSPHIAIVLMVTSEHLDYHPSQEAYVQAKAGITKFQTTNDTVIYNGDYPGSVAIAAHSPGKKFVVSRKHIEGDGCTVKNNLLIVQLGGQEEIYMAASDFGLVGQHNWENICAAVMAAKVLGRSDQAIISTIKKFAGLEHRLEFVEEKSGVRYYNDSISTTPESAIAALQAFPQPKIIILGGSSKQSDFTQLADVIKTSQVKAIIGIGQEWTHIKEVLGSTDIQLIEGLETMNDIVAACAQTAAAGDVVLLSPACASFGMFHDYKDRGHQFKDAVKAL